MIRNLTYALTLLTLLAATSCGKPDSVNLLIVYTGNVHGAIIPYDFKNDTANDVSLANISSFIHDMHDVYGADHVLTLDVGGTMTGRIEAYYSNFVDTVSEPIYYRAERLVGYDAIGIAQRDLDIDECLSPQRRSPSYDRPVLCANILDSRTGKPFFKPYAIFRRGGVKVAVLGLTSPEISAWLPKSEWRYIQTQDMVECAQQWVPYIMEREKPDLMVGLFGTSRVYQSAANGYDMDTYKNPQAGIPVAKRVPGFDLVILANDNDSQSFNITNDAGQDVRIVNVGVLAENVGSSLVNMTLGKDGKYTKRIFTNITRSSRYEVDPAFVEEFKQDFHHIRAWMNRTLGVVAEPILPQIGICGPTPYCALLHNAQLWYTGADISLASILTDMNVIKPGPVTSRDMLDIYKYENLLITIHMTGEELHRLLEYTYSQQLYQMHGPDDQLLALALDPEGNVARSKDGHAYLTIPPSSFMSAGGIHYVVDVSKPAGERVTILSMRDGSPFDIRNTYTVAVNSYHGSGGAGILTNGIGWNTETLQMHIDASSPINIRHAISSYIEHIGTVHADYDSTEWRMEPRDWVIRARERGRKEPHPIW